MRFQTLTALISLITIAFATSASTIQPTAAPSIASNVTTATHNKCENYVKLFAYPESGDGIRTGISYYHEGAGINYLFLSGPSSPVYIYNHCANQIYTLPTDDPRLYLSEIDGFVEYSVRGPNGEFTIEDSYLAVDGVTDGWLACKNTGDPYNYSRNLPQLAFTGTQFTECSPILVQVESA